MAKEGQQVVVSYVGRFDDGEIFDSTESHGGELLEFTVGDGKIIAGFDAAVREMELGETRTVAIEPKDAYGEYDSNLLKGFKRSELGELADQLADNVGQTVYLQSNNGVQEVTVVAANEDEVTVDFNHRMAGKRLNFEITLEKVGDDVATHAHSAVQPELSHKPGETE